MKKLTLLTLTLVLIAAMAVTTATAQQYVHTDTLTGHTEWVHGLAFKDNGTLISGSNDDTLRAWNVTTGTQRWVEGVGNDVVAVALALHNPRFIAYGGYSNNHIRMRYSDDGDWRGDVAGHTGTVLSLAFKPNSYQLASGSRDDTVRIWDVSRDTNLQHLRTLRGHTADVISVAWSPDGRTLASASHDGTVRLWNPNNGINFAVLRGHTDNIYCVAWSPDGRILASGSDDNTIRLWNPDTHGTLRVLRGHTNRVQSLAFHPNGQTLASGSADNTIRLWNPNTGAHKATLTGYRYGFNGLAFSPNGQILAGGGPRDRNISLWRLLTVDVNGDGVVDREDLLAVARNYGWVWEDPSAEDAAPDAGEILFEDIDEDGDVDIDDLIAVAQAIDAAAAAPALTQADIETGSLQASDVQQWIRDAKAANADPAGIAALERLLTSLSRRDLPVPKETVLLANYPNPFNPETWIPYQLSETAEITVTIHASDGKLVRTLELGQLPAGTYQNRSRAAYWNGRNAQGEPVASGVYFYTLKAGEFSATRKMVIRK